LHKADETSLRAQTLDEMLNTKAPIGYQLFAVIEISATVDHYSTQKILTYH
jgi:hypothetical protein